MQTTNVIYQQLMAKRHTIEYKVEIAGETYNHTDIIGAIETASAATPEIANAVFDKFSVGNAPSATLKISLIPKGTIPPMSLVEVYYRLYTPTIQSVWMPKGKFYIDTRKKDNNGILTFNCFDAMLKGEYTFMESGSWTSTTALATVQMIASDMGVNIESNTTTILTNTPKSVPYVPAIGEDGTTGRDMLCYIASMYGGNFVIDELGYLKLIQLIPPATTLNIGVLASSHDTAPAFDAIDRVVLKLDEKTGYRSPESTFDTLTGRILEAYCPWTSQELADGLLSIVNGFVYQPYEAIGADIDPACQLGDGVTVKGITSQIYSQVIHLDARCADDISAPYEEEVNHEYPYRSAAQRKIDDSVTQEQLATAGQTTINGSNIHSGTITLGGDGNGEGELHILDSNNAECGSWDNQGIVIFDNSELNGSLTTDNKIRIVRQGDPEDADEAVKVGVLVLPNFPDYRQPYVELYGKAWDATLNDYVIARARLSSQQLLMTWNNEGFSIEATPSNKPLTVTRTSGQTVSSASFHTWGRMAMLTLKLNATSGSYSAGDNVFVGSIADYLPISAVMGCGYYSSGSYAGMIDTNGNITVRATSYLGFSGGDVTISFTYLF